MRFDKDRENGTSSGIDGFDLFFMAVHVEARAYAHWTDFLISTVTIYARPNLCT